MANTTYTIRPSADGNQYSQYPNGNYSPSVAMPESFQVSAVGSNVNLSWVDVSGGAATFEIVRSVSQSTGYAIVLTPGANSITAQDTSVPNGLYYYKIRARVGTTYSAYTDPISVVVSTGSTWQLASGYYEPRKSNMVLIHPRPDSETSVYAQHRNAYPGLAWSTRIDTAYGSWPFRFELTGNIPAGMTIGNQLSIVGDVLEPAPGYGVISWPNPIAGTYTITGNIYDQEYGRGGSPTIAIPFSFTLEVGTARHVFISPPDNPTPGNDTTGTGTLTNPFLTTFRLHNGSGTTSTFNGRLVWLRGGTHALGVMSTNNNNYAILSGGAPCVFIGYPGETAIIRQTQGWFALNTGANDFMLKDLILEHANAFRSNQYMVAQVATCNRHSYHGVTFRNYYRGADGFENACAVYYTTGGINRYISVQGCTVTGQMGNWFTLYGVTDYSIQRNIVANASFSQTSPTNDWGIVYSKDGCNGGCIRANNCVTGNSFGSIQSFHSIGGQNDAGNTYSFNNIQISYNFVPSGFLYGIFGNYEYGAGPVGTVYGFRNSVNDVVQDRNNYAAQPTVNQWNSNAISGGFVTMTPVFTQSGNLTGAGIFDSNVKIAAAYRAANLGLVGAEIKA